MNQYNDFTKSHERCSSTESKTDGQEKEVTVVGSKGKKWDSTKQ
jgi:hypothetical protein